MDVEVRQDVFDLCGVLWTFQDVSEPQGLASLHAAGGWVEALGFRVQGVALGVGGRDG